MKKLIVSLCLVVVGITMTTSCNWIDPNLNVDPNNPVSVTPQLILPGMQGSIAWVYGGSLSRFSNLFTQQYFGSDRQHQGYYNYNISEADPGDIWGNIYINMFANGNNLIDQATKLKAPHHRGIARIIMVMAIGAATDAWGDVPYSQAGKGESGAVFAPKLDTQQEIYTKMQSELDEAIKDLGSKQEAAAVAREDMIFSGDISRWSRLARSLKARYAIHLTKKGATAAAQSALTALKAGSMQGNDDNCLFYFGEAATQSNPLYQFLISRAGDMAFGTTFGDMLLKLKDPRLSSFAKDAAKPSGGAFGPYYFSANSPIMMMSFAESKFIEAEAAFRTGATADARSAYIDAVKASLDQFGVSASDVEAYMAQTDVVPASGITLERIMEQKHIALFTQPESWTDWRRTGFPALTPVEGSNIPRRIPYPQAERERNPAIPVLSRDKALFDKIWWDQ